MKRVYLALGLLALCISLCTFEQYTVERMYKDTTAMINDAIECTEKEDFKNAEKICKNLKAYWDKKYPYLTAMIDHGALDEAAAVIYSLEDMAKDESEDLKNELTAVKNQIKIIRENQKVSLGNIL
ncbi:MAG: DUF4363 family protein [Eubacteriales bacterium]|nr:DUF4363 family protein [Eubacteriales bacterium]